MTALLLLSALAWADEPPPTADEAAPEMDFRGHIDQARFFIRRKWYRDAEVELEKAVKLRDGKLDPEAWYMLAQVRYELTDVEGARDAAERSHTYSRTGEELAQAAGFSQYLNDQFGVVEVRAPYPGMEGVLDIELQSVLFDPDLKRYIERVGEVYSTKAVLPKRFGLPAGTYTINGRQVGIAPNDYVGVDLDMSEVSGKKALAVQIAQIELGLGGAVWLGDRVDNLFPSLTAQLAYTQPFGSRLIGGVMVDWTPQPYQTVWGDVSYSTSAWSAGGRLGTLVPGTQPLQVRPSVGYRYGYVPGIELACLASDDNTFACNGEPDPELMVYTVARAHIPMIELSVEFLDRTKSRGLGFGVKAVGEMAFGTNPEGATATVAADGTSVPYTVGGDRAWSATGFRFLSNLSLAF